MKVRESTLCRRQEHGAVADAEPVILIDSGSSLDELKEAMQSVMNASPNAAEFMSKYRNKESKDAVEVIRVRWGREGRDSSIFPRETILTEDNCGAVLHMMAVSVGKDVFDVKLQAHKPESSE